MFIGILYGIIFLNNKGYDSIQWNIQGVCEIHK